MASTRFQRLALLLGGATAIVMPAPLLAQDNQVYQFDIPAQALGDALRRVAAQAGLQLYAAADDVNDLAAPRVRGAMTAQQAIETLLAGTQMRAQIHDGAVIIRRDPPTASAATDTSADPVIVVTGTHIRSGETTSPVISASRDAIEKSGRTNLGDFVRDLPQNFNGGQNPGVVGGGVQGGSENLASTSTLNLRGLGPDATLTLINGHRIAYDGAFQGVDISAIPLAALDRLEIVADGASALYGSDAVGGVANIILRRDYDGIWSSARLSGTTEGGNFQQQYGLVTGARWQSGGFMAAGDFNRSTAIAAGQRSVTAHLHPSATLLPAQRQYSAVFAGHQSLTDQVEFEFDGQYSRRRSNSASPLTTTAPATTSGYLYSPSVESYSITPSVRLSLPGGWEMSLSGTLGRSLTEVESRTFSDGSLASVTRVAYDNQLQSLELRGDGTLAVLPGGDLGLAVGAGYRGFSLDAESRRHIGASTVNLLNIDHKENVVFAFGEIAVPLFGADNARPFLDFLQLTGAVRYERYDELASVASPKLGFIYRPTSAVTIRGGWGKSFKAPTFYQRYKTYQALLLPAALLGEAGGTASRPVLYVAGGNADLEPERASVWNLSLSYEPPTIPSLHLEANYYNVRYRNRVADPIASVLGVLSNPAYASLVTFDPSAALLDGLIAPAASALGLQNLTGGPYDPSTVYAVVDARANNTAYQTAEGIDLSARYRLDLNSGGHVDFTAGASYIESERRLIESEDPAPFAGVIFRSPHWRARSGATFEQDNVALSAFVQYAGGVTDDRIEPKVRVDSFLAADLSARLSGSTGIWRGADLTLTISNIFNEMPDRIRSRSAVDPGYDSTNYSVLGRTISITLAKRW